MTNCFDAFFVFSVLSLTDENALTGSLPSEIGLMTSLSDVQLCECAESVNVGVGCCVLFCFVVVPNPMPNPFLFSHQQMTTT